MNKLKNKVIAVTGGSGLIGRSILKQIDIEGGIAVNLDIDCVTDPGQHTIKCDITREEEILPAFKLLVDTFGRIDGLVNAAYPRTEDWGDDFEEIKTTSWQKNIDWQLTGCFISSRAAIRQMLKQGGGAVVNIASIYGVVGSNFNIYEGSGITPPAAYSVIKGGIINFTRYLASKYAKNGIRVNCVSPGGVYNRQDPSFVQAYEQQVPIRRMAAPEDIAPGVVFLLSDEAQYVIGHNLIIDGGWTAI
ncbi:MAG: SDR family oxidoreductase [Bacteroidales bacterium]|nr:SDR family oxidoreductase [Bacteroidales bacterium]